MTLFATAMTCNFFSFVSFHDIHDTENKHLKMWLKYQINVCVVDSLSQIKKVKHEKLRLTDINFVDSRQLWFSNMSLKICLNSTTLYVSQLLCTISWFSG